MIRGLNGSLVLVCASFGCFDFCLISGFSLVGFFHEDNEFFPRLFVVIIFGVAFGVLIGRRVYSDERFVELAVLWLGVWLVGF